MNNQKSMSMKKKAINNAQSDVKPNILTSGKALSRDDYVTLAIYAQEAEQYDHMVEYAKSFAFIACTGENEEPLDNEERQLIYFGFKRYLGERRAAHRALKSILKKEEGVDQRQNIKWVIEYKGKLEGEMTTICKEAIQLLDKHLIPTAKDDNEVLVFYYKMKADYWRYITEFAEGEMKNMAAQKCNSTYQHACKIAEKHIRATNPLYLSLMLNLAVYYYETLMNEERALQIMRSAFDKAIELMDDIQEKDYKEVTLLMQLMKDNMTLWSKAEQMSMLDNGMRTTKGSKDTKEDLLQARMQNF